MQMAPEDLREATGLAPGPESLLILCNIWECFRDALAQYPFIDSGRALAGLISYWVSKGTTVLLCERHDEPQKLLDTILENGKWEQGSSKAAIASVFKAPTTTGMTDLNPIGEWSICTGCVLLFES